MKNRINNEEQFNEGACCIAKSLLYLVLLYFFSDFFYVFILKQNVDITTEK